MVDGLNAVEIAVGGVAGATFGSIFDGITEVLRNAAEFTTSHTNIKSTLEALQPLIREIEGKNKRLLLQDEALKDLKKEIEAGVKRVQELSKKSVWNYCMRPLYNMELDGMDKSLKRLLRILQVQGVRDVKEVLVQVNDCKTDVNKISIQLDDCKTGIVRYGEETLNMTRTVLDLFERINGPSGFVPISEKVASLVEEEALRSSLVTMRHAVDEALSKPNPHNNISRIEEALRRVVEELGDVDENRKLDMRFDEVKWFRIKVEEGTELIRKCSNVVEWTDRKMVKYANKLDDLVKFLETFGQRLKRTNSTVPKGFDTQNSITLISFLSLLPSLFKSLSLSLIFFTFFVSPPIILFILLLLFLSISSNHLFSFSFFQSFFTFFSPVSSFSLTCDPPISLSSLNRENQAEIENEKLIFMKSNRSTDDVNGENRTEIENEKLIFMKSNRPTDDVNGENRTEIENAKLIFMKSNQPTDDVNGENRTEIENEKLIFMKSNRPTDDVNGENRTEIENAKLIFMKSNQPTDDVNGENRTEIEHEMLIFKKSNRPTDDVNGLRNDGNIGHHDSSVFGCSSVFAATSNFAEENKIGEGGFGPVYKGKLAMGQKKVVMWRRMLIFMKTRPTDDVNGLRNDGKIGHHDSSVFSYSSILAATSNFAEENKLGQGGFGKVYKGKLAMGQEIAVKRHSKRSGQGLSEFKNELILNELQHTNLVQLFGSCIHGKEMMLIYEYMQNKSLEHFLFDPTRGRLLDWKKRFSIIEGIAQGLLYLHKYSRKKVIHRDLKPSNILLDENMNPKISDFGLARIFTQNELEANTSRIVGNPKISDFGTARMFIENELKPTTTSTIGIAGTMSYMAPENIHEGIISVKSDVYSFGVLMLEIISGRKINRFYNDDRPVISVGYARELWTEGAGLELMDPTLGNSFIKEQLLRCIHVGLLCVEENAADRPTMSDVISMLTNESLPLASPTKPAFCVGWRTVESQTDINWSQQSANYMSNSDFEAR